MTIKNNFPASENVPELKRRKAMQCEEIKKQTEDSSKKVAELFSAYSIESDNHNPDLFERTLLAKLEKAERIEKKQSFNYRWLAVAAVFAIIVSVSFVSYFNSIENDRELISSTTSAIGEPIRIVMQYESDADYKNVSVFFKLDDGIEFYSDNKEFRAMRSYAWKGSLKKGVNQIPFVIEVISQGKWKILTDARYNGFSHRHSIELDTDGKKVSITMFSLSSKKI